MSPTKGLAGAILMLPCLIVLGCGSGTDPRGVVDETSTAASEPSPASARPSEQATYESVNPATIMFCEPLTQGEGVDVRFGTVLPDDGFEIDYSGDGCNADVDEGGGVLVRSESGLEDRTPIEFLELSQVFSLRSVVWIPAKGELNGKPTVLTGAMFRRDAEVVVDALGDPGVVLNTTEEGRDVAGSLTERIDGRPLATFLDDRPLPPAGNQRFIAPIVHGRIDETFLIRGISIETANYLAALVNSGNAR
jgi:hypothetical protein